MKFYPAQKTHNLSCVTDRRPLSIPSPVRGEGMGGVRVVRQGGSRGRPRIAAVRSGGSRFQQCWQVLTVEAASEAPAAQFCCSYATFQSSALVCVG
jgi:hypothetical protein